MIKSRTTTVKNPTNPGTDPPPPALIYALTPGGGLILPKICNIYSVNHFPGIK